MKYMHFLVLIVSALFLNACATTPISDGIHRVVIQVSSDDPRTQTMALNNAINIQKEFGANNVNIELVAYGPGLSLLQAESKQARRVKSLAAYDNFTFHACNHTMSMIKRRQGKMPRMVEGINVVPNGVAKVVELQEKGYSYIRP
ncbi:MAG: DsrE family protein [Gammaproteobacteria bacterium]|nr:DsrE family protein [Gammaproteobacteria bacterium]